MKKGCLTLIVIILAAFVGYRQYLNTPALSDQTWIPFVMAIGAGIVAGNIQGLFLALRQKSASNRPRSEWRDGDYVVASGRIQTLRSFFEAPFSGTPSAIVEYSIKRGVGNDSSPAVDDFSGFMMAPCAVQTLTGSVNLTGFPLLAKIPKAKFSDEQTVKRAADFIANTKFKARATNPIEAVKEFNKVLEDGDGDIQAHFISKNAEIVPEGDEDLLMATTMQLQTRNYVFEESVVANGAEITAAGTFRADKQSIDVGSGLSNLSHTLSLGGSLEVTKKALTQATVGLILFSSAFAAGNYYLLKQTGFLPK